MSLSYSYRDLSPPVANHDLFARVVDVGPPEALSQLPPVSSSLSVQVLPKCTFEESLSKNLHSRLIVKAKHSKRPFAEAVAPHQVCTTEKPSTTPTTPERESSTTDMVNNFPSSPKLTSLLLTQVEAVAIDASRSMKRIRGPKEKWQILGAYEDRFRDDPNVSIVTKIKGKRMNEGDRSKAELHLPVDETFDCEDDCEYRVCNRMRPSSDKYYRVEDLSFHNVLSTVLREQRASFSQRDMAALRSLDRICRKAVPLIERWLAIDITSLSEPRFDYENQQSIDPNCVEMMSAAMIKLGLDPGRLVRFLDGEYIGSRRQVRRTINAVQGHVSAEDLKHMKRILLQGCPAKLAFTESAKSKRDMIDRGNQKNFVDNPDIVNKTLNKEERYNHLIPMHEVICLLSPYLRHTSQGLILKDGKSPRMVWDGSTKRTPLDNVLNEITSILDEAEITFGDTKRKFLTDLYNMRISYPDAMILLALADIKACFRFGRIHPDLTGAFGFLAGGFYNLATAMVFGSNTSATSWEPFRRAIEALSLVFLDRTDLVEKHARFLDMIQWSSDIDQVGPFTRASACPLNLGVIGDEGKEVPHPARIYVDDALMAAISRERMRQTLAAIIEAIFVVMGDEDVSLRQCPLAMDKWEALVVGPRQTVLGLIVDTRTLSISMPLEYIQEVRHLLDSTWHIHRKRFTVGEAQQLTGKLARMAEAAPWVYHLLSHLYFSMAAALAENRQLLGESSDEFQAIIQSIRTFSSATPGVPDKERSKHIAFAIKRAARMVHHSKYQYNINTTMRSEIEFFRMALASKSDVLWETPIAHLIKKTPFAVTVGDSCLDGAGGYSTGLGFWWHLSFPQEVVDRTLLHKPDNSDGRLVSINVLEFVTVVINYCAAVHVITTMAPTDDPHPVVLNITDNRSASNWTSHACLQSKLGRLLARLFCFLLMDSPVGINSKWIATDENVIADDISRIKRQNKNCSSQPSFDYTTLTQRYPELKACTFFQIEPELLSLIWEIVLTEKWPQLERIRTLRRKPLGKLTT